MSQDLLALTHCFGAGIQSCRKVLTYFGDARTAYQKISVPLMQRLHISPSVIADFTERKKHLNITHLTNIMHRWGIIFISADSEEYPKLLKETSNYPLGLYIMGSLRPDLKTLTVVGTRRITPYGQRTCDNIVSTALADFSIASGNAYGVDKAVHRACLNHRLHTVAVLGSGLEVALKRGERLLNSIVNSGGAVISELPLDFHATAFTFPMRNRILAGMSQATLVIEAAKRSGALITAQQALHYNRDVLAVPGRTDDEYSLGTNDLLLQGAGLVRDSSDVLFHFGIHSTYIQPEKLHLQSKDEEVVYSLLRKDTTSIDQLVAQSGLEFTTILDILSSLEIRKIIRKNIFGYTLGGADRN